MAKENLTEHFTLEEMTRTKSKADNTPSAEQVKNLKKLCWWLEMLRGSEQRISVGRSQQGGRWRGQQQSSDWVRR